MYKALILDDDGEQREVVEGEVTWGELDPAKIIKLALCNDNGEVLAVIDKPDPEINDSFQEFIQYQTAHITGVSVANTITDVVAQAGGWTDGKYEYVIVVDIPTERLFMQTLPRMHFHPKSVDNPRNQQPT